MKMTSQLTAGILFALSLAACGKGGAEVKGKLGGQELQSKSASFETQTINGASKTQVIISDNDAFCDDFKANKNKAQSRDLALTVASPAALKAGKYDISPTADANATLAFGGFVSLNATCDASTEENAESGSVTITKVESGTLEGSFDLSFKSGDKATGSFTASDCSGLVTRDPNSAAPGCKK